MKKQMRFIGVLTAIILSLGMINGCGLFGGNATYHEISSLEDLYAMESNKNYQLMCDLDLGEREWFPLSVHQFNGNGHTISNGIINSTISGSKYRSGFFEDADKVVDVKFSNMQYNFFFNNDESPVYFGTVAGYCNDIANVTVSNSSIMATVNTTFYFGGVKINCGGLVGAGKTIIDSNVNYTNIIVNVGESCTVYMGGLCGEGNSNIENCSVTNNTLKCINNMGAATCGFICGWTSVTDITNCYTKNNTLEITTNSSTVTRAGGIVGLGESDSGIIEACLSENNNITINCTQGYNIGGIAGRSNSKITNCLSDSNVLSAKSTSSSSTKFAGIGGVCGSAYATISKCVAQFCTIKGTSSSGNQKFATGLVSDSEASITYCAVNQNHISGGNVDVFTTKNENIHYCYINQDNVAYPNSNDVTILGESEWENIIDLLQLDSKLWEIDATQHLTIKTI